MTLVARPPKLNDRAQAAFALQSYESAPRIEGVEIITLKRRGDDGGSFTEISRLSKGVTQEFKGFEAKQINFSEMDSGVIKAFHLHRNQTDVWFVPPSDKMLVVLKDVRENSPTENNVWRIVMGGGEARLLRIPPGVAHGVKNIGQAVGRIIYLVDHHFNPDPKHGQEGRLPWDFAGAEVWEIQKG